MLCEFLDAFVDVHGAMQVTACMSGCPRGCAGVQIVEDDITAQEAKAARRTATSDKVAEGRAPGAPGAEGGKPINPTAVKILLPALKELMQGMGTQYDLLKEVVAAVQVCSPLLAPPPLAVSVAPLHTQRRSTTVLSYFPLRHQHAEWGPLCQWMCGTSVLGSGVNQ